MRRRTPKRRALTIALAVVALSSFAVSQNPAGHDLPTAPVALPGLPAPRTGTFVVTDSGLNPRLLKAKLGRAAAVRPIAAGLEVSGVSAGHLAVTVHAMTETAFQMTTKGNPVRPTPLGADALGRLSQVNTALVRYALARNFGQPLAPGAGPTLTRASYPAAKCPAFECAMCPAPPTSASDCSGLERGKDGAYDAYLAKLGEQELWQAIVSARSALEFYGGMAGTLADLVAAATSTLGSSAASPNARGAATLLVQMARDGALETTLEELGLQSLAGLTKEAGETRLSNAEAKRVAAGEALLQARKQWGACMNEGVARASARDQKAAVIDYDGCRFRLHLGEGPECKIRDTACP
jgi:hypothetical protein